MEPYSRVVNFQVGSLIIKFVDGDNNPIPNLRVVFEPKKRSLPKYDLKTDQNGRITIRSGEQSTISNQQSSNPAGSSILPVNLKTLKNDYVLRIVEGFPIANIYLEELDELGIGL